MQRLLSRLRFPLIQAPMAGGFNTIELVEAVRRQGCIGSFGFAYSSPQKIASDLKAVGPRMVHANFFVFSKIVPPSKREEELAIQALKTLPITESLHLSPPTPPYYPNLDEQLEPIWQYKPEVLTFHFGLPSTKILEQAKNLGILVGVSCTSKKEFLILQDAGVDFAIAQGIEAGGHRGTFVPNDPDDEELSIDDLLRALHPVAKIPIIASGGLMSGADIARVLRLGASAVQLGTAFLTCKETGTPKAHRDYIFHQPPRESLFVNSFSGRRARGLRNAFIEQMAGQPILPFPLQNTLTGTIRRMAVEQGDGEYQSLWVGKHYHHCQESTAEELIQKLEAEFRQEMQSSSG